MSNPRILVLNAYGLGNRVSEVIEDTKTNDPDNLNKILTLEGFNRYLNSIPGHTEVRLNLANEHDRILYDYIGLVAPSEFLSENLQLREVVVVFSVVVY